MSSATYEELLREAIVDLEEMKELDCKSVGRKVGADKMADYGYFLQHWAAMYLRYVQIVRKLDSCHDQILQPQKRQDVRVLLDSCMGRMLEMKEWIVKTCGEYVNLDDALVDLKLTPDALEIPIPKYFVEERQQELANRRKFIDSLISLHRGDQPANDNDEESEAATAPKLPEMKLDRAIEIIQANERGRQGRQRAKFLKQIYETEQTQHNDFEYGSMGREEAARNIQKIVRGFLERKKAQRMMKEELEFLGMEMSDAVKSNQQKVELLGTMGERKMNQRKNIGELEQEAKDMRARIKIQEGGRAMEEMLDEVLMYMANVRLMSKDDTIPDIPEEGGTLALMGMVQKPPSAEEEAAKKAEEEKAAQANQKKPEKKSDKELEEENLPTVPKSLFWDRFSAGRERYVHIWNKQFQQAYLNNRDFEQRFDKDILREEIMDGPGGITAELRKCVDQLVMVEVANLRDRFERERGKKPKKPKQKKEKKKKPVKDPTEGRKLEEHMSRLVHDRALMLPKNQRLEEYIGAHNMMASVLEEHDRSRVEQLDEVKKKWDVLIDHWNPVVEKSLRMNKDQFAAIFQNFKEHSERNWMFEPSMAQVRQNVTEYCILPLGSQVVHDMAYHPNTVLFYGPPKSGKTMLTHIVCNEAGANLFSLSPNVLAREGLHLPKLVQSVFRVARALAPSVIYIDDCEKVFAKKKKGKADPIAAKCAKIKKDLNQGIKELDQTDRVLVIGNSRTPWDAEAKDLMAFFNKMIYTVHPDYASRMLIWQSHIKQLGAELQNDYEYEVLAYMSNKYTSGTIIKVIDETLTHRRLKRINQRPVKAEEFLPALARAQPVFVDDYKALSEFVDKLLPPYRRAKFPEDFKEEEVEDPKKKKDAKKPGKK